VFAGALLGGGALVCGRGCAIDDAVQVPYSSQPYERCTVQWSERTVAAPDGEWFGCTKEYCFDGTWVAGDRCPSDWPELGLFGPSCRSGCVVELPCQPLIFKNECCDLVCADASAPDAAPEPDSGRDAGADSAADGAGDGAVDGNAEVDGEVDAGDVDVVVDAGSEAESD
jgi:hypothetical protein